MVFNATLNNISVILWWSVLLVEETRVLRENHTEMITSFTTSGLIFNLSNVKTVSLIKTHLIYWA